MNQSTVSVKVIVGYFPLCEFEVEDREQIKKVDMSIPGSDIKIRYANSNVKSSTYTLNNETRRKWFRKNDKKVTISYGDKTFDLCSIPDNLTVCRANNVISIYDYLIGARISCDPENGIYESNLLDMKTTETFTLVFNT